jgi:hypothetical protein
MIGAGTLKIARNSRKRDREALRSDLRTSVGMNGITSEE